MLHVLFQFMFTQKPKMSVGDLLLCQHGWKYVAQHPNRLSEVYPNTNLWLIFYILCKRFYNRILTIRKKCTFLCILKLEKKMGRFSWDCKVSRMAGTGTYVWIHCCRVSLSCSVWMGWASVRSVGWNSVMEGGRYLNQPPVLVSSCNNLRLLTAETRVEFVHH